MELLYIAFYFLAWPVTVGWCFPLPLAFIHWVLFMTTWFCGRCFTAENPLMNAYKVGMLPMLLWAFVFLVAPGPPIGAEATRIINDARSLKAAAITLYENTGTLSFQSAEGLSDLEPILDRSLAGMKRHIVTVTVEERGSLIGVAPLEENLLVGKDAKEVRKRLARDAHKTGLLDADGRVYTGEDAFAFIVESGRWRE